MLGILFLDNAYCANSVAQPRAVCAYMTMQDAYHVKITLQLRAPNGHSNFDSIARGTMRDTHRIHVYYVNGCVIHGKP